jgi:hypothetical protein
MTSRYSTAGLAVLFLLLSQPAGFADSGPSVGYILEVKGQAQIKRSESPWAAGLDWSDATVDMPVYPGDLIKTGRDGSVKVVMRDGALLSITPGALVPFPWPDADDDRHWKRLAEDLWVLLSTDDLGVTRGRLYVRIDDKWTAVALESPEEFLPDVLPLDR